MGLRTLRGSEKPLNAQLQTKAAKMKPYPFSRTQFLIISLIEKLFPIVLLLLLTIQVAIAQDAGQLTSQQQNRLDKIATQDVPRGGPGIATGIVLDGKIVYSKCAGFQNITDGSSITPKSRFNIASNGKQFTALAILQLEAQGKLSLQDDIRKYFPNLYKKIDVPLTIEHLLTHTSGIRDVYGLWALQGRTWWKFNFNNDDVLKLLTKQENLNFEPGTEFLYSNSNYIILAELVSKVTKDGFVAYTNSMFQKLGMPDTSFESDHQSIRGPVAKPYFNFESWKGYDWICDVVGDGCLFSTLEDQLQWECLVQNSGETDFDRSLIERSQRLVNPELCQTYGFGLEIRQGENMVLRFHDGSTGAWKANTLRYPEQKLAVVTLSNSGKTIPSMQSKQMVSILIEALAVSDSKAFQTEPPKTGPRLETAEILGTYLSQGAFLFEFVQVDGKLFLRRNDRNDVQLERESANVFHEVNDPKFKQEFVKNENNEMQVTAYHNTHAPYSLTRVKCDFTGFNFQSLNGTFVNSETGSEFKIDHVKDQEFTISLKDTDKPRKAQLVTPNKMVSGSYVIQWPGKLDSNTALLVSISRVRRVKFVRQPAP